MLKLYSNIKKYRIERGMTQSELAVKTGYADKSMIARIERGEIDLSHSRILEFAKALHVKAADLMEYEAIDKENDNGVDIVVRLGADDDFARVVTKLCNDKEFFALCDILSKLNEKQISSVKVMLNNFFE